MRIQQITINEATDACSRIGELVYKMGLTGEPALSMEARLYHALFTELLDSTHATHAAIEYVAHRHGCVAKELNALHTAATALTGAPLRNPGVERLG
jgi:hypothetical protein